MPKRNPGARLEWRDDRGGGTWEIQWTERGSRKRRGTGTAERAEAEKQLIEFLQAKHRDTIGPCDPAQRLIGDVLADYVGEHGEHVAARETLGYCVQALARFWGERSVRDVREGTCRAYVAHREKAGAKATTAARELAALGAAIRHDWRAGRLTEMVPIWKPPMAEPKDRWLTRKEAANLLRQCRGYDRRHLALFARIALHTGARAEAILSLRWPQIDLDRKLIDFNPPGKERTAKWRPIIPIPDRLMVPLRAARRRGTDLGPVLAFRGKAVESIKTAFSKACQRAGLDDVTPHTLRHTCASWLAQSGVPFPVIARYLGHAGSRRTERIYAHHAPDYLKAATDAIGRRTVR
ncbi:MAG: tyrosine-type recombinase/integrase [Azospirillum sp.]|nr:tyrosine-type recombinase/integrase [Azospirillum sp.]